MRLRRRARSRPGAGATDCVLITGLKAPQVSAVLEAGLLGERTPGFRGDLIARDAAVDLRVALDTGVPLGACASELGLTPAAVEQLASKNILRMPDHPAFEFLYADPYIDRASLREFCDNLKAGSPVMEFYVGWVPLSLVMRGIGGRAKPWAKIVSDILVGRLPARRTSERLYVPNLLIPVRAAAKILDREARSPDVDEVRSTGLTELEASEYLNVSWRGLQALVDRELLVPDQSKPSRQLPSAQAVQLGHRYISSHEIAARRLKHHPRAALSDMARLGLRPVVGDFLWDRRDVASSYLV